MERLRRLAIPTTSSGGYCSDDGDPFGSIDVAFNLAGAVSPPPTPLAKFYLGVTDGPAPDDRRARMPTGSPRMPRTSRAALARTTAPTRSGVSGRAASMSLRVGHRARKRIRGRSRHDASRHSSSHGYAPRELDATRARHSRNSGES